MKLQKPFPEGYSVNPQSPFGWRRDPFTGKRRYHRGIDIGGNRFPVTAAGDGKVVHIGWSPNGGGHTVILKHADDLFTVYYHGAEATHLRRGSRVQAGDLIYLSGSTGRSTGPHLHFECRTSQRWGTQVDPIPYLQGSPTVSIPLLKVNGRLGRATWKAWQDALKKLGLYSGLIDGRPGRHTYRAVQKWAGVTADGIIGPITRRAVQKKLGVKEDGIWGRITISALQRALNEGRI